MTTRGARAGGAVHVRRPALAGMLALLALSQGGCLTNRVVGDHPEWRRPIAAPADHDLTPEDVRLTSRDGVLLSAWWCRSAGPAGTVILVHGSAANRSHMLARAAFLHRHGYDAFVLDLRAHGDSEGDYMTPGHAERLDVLASVDFLVERRAATPLVVLGHSYGAVAAVHAAAASSEIDGLVLEGVFKHPDALFARYRDLLEEDETASPWLKLGMSLAMCPLLEPVFSLEFWVRTGVWVDANRSAALGAVAGVHAPVLFVVGERDRLAPLDDARELSARAGTGDVEVVVIPGAGHQVYEPAGANAWQSAVLAFLERLRS